MNLHWIGIQHKTDIHERQWRDKNDTMSAKKIHTYTTTTPTADDTPGIDGFAEDVHEGDERIAGPNAGESPPSRTDSSLARSEWWSALFWLVLGFLTVGLVLQFAGFDRQLLAPGVVLLAYGLFLLWNPAAAASETPVTGVMWIALGILGLVLVQAVNLSWAYEVTGILIGFFLVLAGILIVLDL